MVDPQATARAEYAERIQPLLESIAAACIREMPDDTVAFMHRFVSEKCDISAASGRASEISPSTMFAGAEARATGTSAVEPSAGPGGMAEVTGTFAEKGGGKGRVKGKAPAGPAVSPKGDGKGKAKVGPPKTAQSGFAKNMKKLTKPSLWCVWNFLKVQKTDGSVDNIDLGQSILEEYKSTAVWSPGFDPQIDFAGRLDQIHPTAATTFLMCILLKSVGGVDGDVSSSGIKFHAEAQQTAMTTMYNSSYKDSPPPCGEDYLGKGQAWIAAQAPPAHVQPQVLELIDEWFMGTGIKGKVKNVSDEDAKEKSELARRKSLQQRERENESARHWSSLKSRPLGVVPWATAERTKWCSGGMGGATLMQIGGDECVVLKSLSLNAVAEVLAVEVAELLGVRVAASRPLAADAVRGRDGNVKSMAPEFSEMLEAMGRVPMEGATVELIKHRTGLADFVVVMEFVSGTVLQGLPGMKALQSGAAPSILRQLGALISLDCVLNNVDRVPAIWHNDGNFSNVMVTAEGVVGIDQQVNAISDASGKERYFQSLADFCGVAARSDVGASTVKVIATAIQQNCGVELDEASLKLMLEGSVAVFQRVKENRDGLTTALKAIDAKMRGIFGRKTADVGLSQVETMTDFIVECVAIVADAS